MKSISHSEQAKLLVNENKFSLKMLNTSLRWPQKWFRQQLNYNNTIIETNKQNTIQCITFSYNSIIFWRMTLLYFQTWWFNNGCLLTQNLFSQKQSLICVKVSVLKDKKAVFWRSKYFHDPFGVEDFNWFSHSAFIRHS